MELAQGGIEERNVGQFLRLLILQKPGEGGADHRLGDLLIDQAIKGRQTRLGRQSAQQFFLTGKIIFEFQEIVDLRIEQGPRFEAVGIEAVEQIGKPLRIAAQLGGQGLGKPDALRPVDIFHHHHQAVFAPEVPVDQVRALNQPLVAGNQVLPAGIDRQVPQGVIDRGPGQRQGQ